MIVLVRAFKILTYKALQTTRKQFVRKIKNE